MTTQPSQSSAASQGATTFPRAALIAGPHDELTADGLRVLFLVICQLSSFDALRLKAREKQFLLLLAGDSFAAGREAGVIGISLPVRGKKQAQTGTWCARLSTWRPSEIWKMFQDWRRAGWLAVDVAEGLFRLAPDQLPGWADAFRLWHGGGQHVLPLTTEADLHKEFAKISQAAALMARGENAKFSQGSEIAKFSQASGFGGPGAVAPNVSETFNRSDVKRLNVRSDARAEVAKISHSQPPDVEALKARVRKFVGETDWRSETFWNYGAGWRERLFTDEGRTLEAALNSVEAGLRDGLLPLKTRGSWLWNEFQRLRREQAQRPDA